MNTRSTVWSLILSSLLFLVVLGLSFIGALEGDMRDLICLALISFIFICFFVTVIQFLTVVQTWKKKQEKEKKRYFINLRCGEWFSYGGKEFFYPKIAFLCEHTQESFLELKTQHAILFSKSNAHYETLQWVQDAVPDGFTRVSPLFTDQNIFEALNSGGKEILDVIICSKHGWAAQCGCALEKKMTPDELWNTNQQMVVKKRDTGLLINTSVLPSHLISIARENGIALPTGSGPLRR